MKVVAICGSMRFHLVMFEEQVRLAKQGVVALLPVIEPINHEPELTPEEKEIYAKIHFKKIDMSDEILVVNLDDYIGYSTNKEIEYAQLTNKPIAYLYPHEIQALL
jgi:hypothetical protein